MDNFYTGTAQDYTGSTHFYSHESTLLCACKSQYRTDTKKICDFSSNELSLTENVKIALSTSVQVPVLVTSLHCFCFVHNHQVDNNQIL